MAHVTMYTTPFCPYCISAKRMLAAKGVSFSEVDVSRNHEERVAMTTRAKGSRTVPQIFVGEVHVGGFDDMVALDRAGGLDGLLASA